MYSRTFSCFVLKSNAQHWLAPRGWSSEERISVTATWRFTHQIERISDSAMLSIVDLWNIFRCPLRPSLKMRSPQKSTRLSCQGHLHVLVNHSTSASLVQQENCTDQRSCSAATHSISTEYSCTHVECTEERVPSTASSIKSLSQKASEDISHPCAHEQHSSITEWFAVFLDKWWLILAWSWYRVTGLQQSRWVNIDCTIWDDPYNVIWMPCVNPCKSRSMLWRVQQRWKITVSVLRKGQGRITCCDQRNQDWSGTPYLRNVSVYDATLDSDKVEPIRFCGSSASDPV